MCILYYSNDNLSDVMDIHLLIMCCGSIQKGIEDDCVRKSKPL